MEQIPLTLKQAFRLYEILYPHLPENIDTYSFPDFVRYLIDSMKEKDSKAYLRVLELLTGKTQKDFMYGYTSTQLLEVFIVGLNHADVISLVRFMRLIGLKYG